MVIPLRTSHWEEGTGVFGGAVQVLIPDLGSGYLGDRDVFTVYRFTNLYIYDVCIFLYVCYTSIKSFKILICLNK